MRSSSLIKFNNLASLVNQKHIYSNWIQINQINQNKSNQVKPIQIQTIRSEIKPYINQGLISDNYYYSDKMIG
jgi:hypothetical protein